ncbi:DUF4232 domain-containing protein [Actinophytocola sp.]|uniref:DUF4232 domain-containing protein n=1 Tax=Actinophytocola sp. TaxID=1872138 RepID=UPI002D664AA7|nr:DUF4232 domain-containing protein [Actinophytocola sp.]HYQ65115.1 DUF4232 domain-containing protein [Actinophytocola sp.]
MLRNKTGTGAVIAGGAAVVLLLAGCNGKAADTASSQVPSTPGSSSTQPLPTTSEPPTGTSQAQAQPPAPTAAVSDECKVADLSVRLGGGDAAAGTSYRALVFTNKGGRTCTMQGFAGVSFVAGDDGHQVGPAAYRTGAKGAVVTLKAGDSAFADVGFVQVANYDPAACKPTEVRGLRIYPPHDFDSMFLANPGTGCAGTPPGNQLTIATVQPGAGPA